MPRLKQPATTWILEKEAAAKLNYRGDYMRRLCRSGELPINFTNTRGRKYQYSLEDIINYLNNNSTQSH